MIHDNDNDDLYRFEDDDKLTSEAKLALGLIREQHVTIRTFLNLVADILGSDIIKTMEDASTERRKIETAYHRAHNAVKAPADSDLKAKSALAEIAERTLQSKKGIETRLRSAMYPEKISNEIRSPKSNPRLGKSDKDVQSVPDEALDTEDCTDSDRDR